MMVALPLMVLWFGALGCGSTADGTRRPVGLHGCRGGGRCSRIGDCPRGEGVPRRYAVHGDWRLGAGLGLPCGWTCLGIVFACVTLVVLLVALWFRSEPGCESAHFPGAGAVHGFGAQRALFFTGDAFNFYVFFEISMVTAYVMTSYGRVASAAAGGADIHGGEPAGLGAVPGRDRLDVSLTRWWPSTCGRSPHGCDSARQSRDPDGDHHLVALSTKAGAVPISLLAARRVHRDATGSGGDPERAARISARMVWCDSERISFRANCTRVPWSSWCWARSALCMAGYRQSATQSQRGPGVLFHWSGWIHHDRAGDRWPRGYTAAVMYAVLNALNKLLLFLSVSLRGWIAGATFAVGAFSLSGVPPGGWVLRQKCWLLQSAVDSKPLVGCGMMFVGGHFRLCNVPVVSSQVSG